MSPLGGRTILVTRPERQAGALAKLIEKAGGRACRFQALDIVPYTSPALEAVMGRLADFDLGIFISGNAVEHGLAKSGGRARWPATMAVAAIGAGTRRVLEEAGFEDVIAPTEGADSEALLRHPRLQSLAGRRVLVFRGVGGREHLANALRARKASVEYAECYRRERPTLDAAPLIATWSAGGIDAVSVSSSEGLANLDALLGETGRALLRSTPLFVPHERVARVARGLGIGEVVVAGVGDEALVAALVAYFGRAG